MKILLKITFLWMFLLESIRRLKENYDKRNNNTN